MTTLAEKIDELRRAELRRVRSETARAGEARKADRKTQAEATAKARQEKAEAEIKQRARAKFFVSPAATEKDFERAYPALRDELLLADSRQAETNARREAASRFKRVF